MKRSSRRRNVSEKRSGIARKKSVDRRRSANGSGGRRRSSSVRCAKKWSGFNARRGIGLLLLGTVAVYAVYAVRVHLCARVPQQEEAREQVRHFLEPLVLHIEICKILMFFFPRCARLCLIHCWGSYESTKWDGGRSLENC
jgi:hypothetical protein